VVRDDETMKYNNKTYVTSGVGARVAGCGVGGGAVMTGDGGGVGGGVGAGVTGAGVGAFVGPTL
jgi:hypothetical protein